MLKGLGYAILDSYNRETIDEPLRPEIFDGLVRCEAVDPPFRLKQSVGLNASFYYC